jgi:hypothetical protein
MSSPEVLSVDEFQGRPGLSRVYFHEECGADTRVSGDDYVLLECPFRPVTATFCCGCRKLVSLRVVCWADTGEPVSDYRARLAATVPFWRRVRLILFGTAYEGAINLRLDRHGRPLPAPEPEAEPVEQSAA